MKHVDKGLLFFGMSGGIFLSSTIVFIYEQVTEIFIPFLGGGLLICGWIFYFIGMVKRK